MDYDKELLGNLEKGEKFLKLNKYEKAIDCFDKAIKINLNHPGAWYGKGLALASLTKHKKAIKCYDKAIDLSPQFPVAWRYKGISYKAIGKIKVAEECLAMESIIIDNINMDKEIERLKSIKNPTKEEKNFLDELTFYDRLEQKKNFINSNWLFLLFILLVIGFWFNLSGFHIFLIIISGILLIFIIPWHKLFHLIFSE